MERKRVDMISGVRVLFEDWVSSHRYDFSLDDGKIQKITPQYPGLSVSLKKNVLDATNHLLAPSLCHAHTHLDKCFLLSDPTYADLEIVKGGFQEALDLTSRAKARFEKDDLIRRGEWLIAESIAAGVTHMRAFAEADHIVEFKCLDAAIELKRMFTDACKIQICAFAQDPIFSGEHGEINRILIEQAIRKEDVEVVGTAPYVEQHPNGNAENIGILRLRTSLRKQILPTSGTYMQGRPKDSEGGGQRPRGTLQIPQMIKKYGLKGAISINNVGNAFTPQGSCDPLSIASMGVGLYHAGSKADVQMLDECVSTRAKEAIGYKSSPFAVGEEANFALFDGGGGNRLLSKERGRKTLQEVVYDPPKERKTVYKGYLITI